MKKSRIIAFAFLFILGLKALATEAGQPPPTSPAPLGHFKKVIWVIFENESYKPTIKQPDFLRISKYGALFTKMKAEVHPSQGNYIAMVAGSNLGVASDSIVNLPQTHVGDLLERKNLDWRIYAEDYPGNCFLGAASGKYVRKHTPMLSFSNVSTNPKRCAKVESEVRFFDDLKNKNLPAFSMYIPNMDNDGHDTGVNFAGKWFASKFESILSKPAELQDVLFIITFDESALLAISNSIYTVLIGSKVVAGSQNAQALNHTALLKMIEDELQIGNLGREDATAPVITGIWK